MNIQYRAKCVIEELKSYNILPMFDNLEEYSKGIVIKGSQTLPNANGIKCLITIDIQDVYHTIYFNFCRLHNKDKRADVLELLNMLNNNVNFLKYYLDGQDNVMISHTYVSNEDDTFCADDFVSVIMPALASITKSADRILNTIGHTNARVKY